MNEALKAEMKVKQNRQVNHSDTYVSAEIMFLYLFFFSLLAAMQVTKTTFNFAADKRWRLANCFSCTAEKACFHQEEVR